MNTKLINDSKTIDEANRILYKELFAPLQISENDIESLKSDGKEQYIICENKGHMVGVIVVVEKDSEAEILHAVVAPEYRGTGIGKMLWRKSIRSFEVKRIWRYLFIFKKFSFWILE